MHVAVGLGCDRGTPLTTLRQALAEALAQVGVRPSQVAAAASITLKADEPGLLALAREQGWRMAFYTPETLAAVAVPNPSETVRKYTGTPSVSEAAALMAGAALAGLAQALPMQALLVEKYKCRGADGRNATVSIARCDSFFLRFLLVFQP
ncbi:cobalamin biosynthesis protein [Rhodoferax sp.]|uniref:cobalamin biosynthesis protein n=1 Tax=Rhodoferax sp. TaxID=50421 RepID=UPI00275D329E|nr:cobalamin biosynthesis protein [Rhodoferax sp.]